MEGFTKGAWDTADPDTKNELLYGAVIGFNDTVSGFDTKLDKFDTRIEKVEKKIGIGRTIIIALVVLLASAGLLNPATLKLLMALI